MMAVRINRYGGSEAVEINKNIPESTVFAGKVLVNVKAAGVNTADWKIHEGYFQQNTPSITINHGSRFLGYHQRGVPLV